MPFSNIKKFLGAVIVLFFSVLPVFTLKAADDRTDIKISKIDICFGQYVDSLSFYDAAGRLVNHFGGSGGEKCTINFDSDEYLTRVFGKRGAVLDSIGFATNKKEYGPYGGDGGHISFVEQGLGHSTGRPISVVHGRTGDYMGHEVVENITGVSFYKYVERPISPDSISRQAGQKKALYLLSQYRDPDEVQ